MDNTTENTNNENILLRTVEEKLYWKKVKECDEETIINFITVNFVSFFLDLEELRKFIVYLYNNELETPINEIFKNFAQVLKEFRRI